MDKDDESAVKLLPGGNRKTDFRAKRLQGNRSANALFFGVALGFIFSFLFAYSGLVAEDNTNYSFYDYMAIEKNNASDEVSESTNLAEYLHVKVRVLCVVMTSDSALNDRGQIIMNTWGKRCNKLLFFSNKLNSNFTNLVVLRETDNFAKLREAFKYVYTNHLDQFDWILRTTDKSFIVMENLRHKLYQYEATWPVIVGQRFLKQDYMIGVYALSKRAFTRLLEDAFTNPEICDMKGYDGDITLSVCLDHVNIIKIDGLDEQGRGQFFHENPENALFPTKYDPNYDQWYWHKLKQGIESCCSDRLIALQNFEGTHLYYLEYFIYKVHTFGRHRKREKLPEKLLLEKAIEGHY